MSKRFVQLIRLGAASDPRPGSRLLYSSGGPTQGLAPNGAASAEDRWYAAQAGRAVLPDIANVSVKILSDWGPLVALAALLIGGHVAADHRQEARQDRTDKRLDRIEDKMDGDLGEVRTEPRQLDDRAPPPFGRCARARTLSRIGRLTFTIVGAPPEAHSGTIVCNPLTKAARLGASNGRSEAGPRR